LIRIILKKKSNDIDTLLKLYQIYDDHRNARLWFLEGLDATDYNGYKEKYSGASMERSHFVAVCGFFELSGVLVNHGLIDQDLYFEINSKKVYVICEQKQRL
jgi:hypothetical protein